MSAVAVLCPAYPRCYCHFVVPIRDGRLFLVELAHFSAHGLLDTLAHQLLIHVELLRLTLGAVLSRTYLYERLPLRSLGLREARRHIFEEVKHPKGCVDNLRLLHLVTFQASAVRVTRDIEEGKTTVILSRLLRRNIILFAHFLPPFSLFIVCCSSPPPCKQKPAMAAGRVFVLTFLRE